MIAHAALARLRRDFEFARRIPLSRIARRCELRVERAIEARLPRPATRAAADMPLAATPPLPVFAARRGRVAHSATATCFDFFGRVVAMPGRIDWQAPGRTRADRLWHMNLHYMEYLEEADDALVESLLTQWMTGNRLGDSAAGGDAWHCYALSVRAVVWMQQLAWRGARIRPEVRAAAGSSLREQLAYLERRLETDLGGNHLVKNIKALIWASAFFAGPAAGRWRRLGLHHLEQALARQILPDGVHFERSPAYHCQVFADLIECRLALGCDPLGGALDAALASVARATADLAHPDGHVAQFNDAGLHMAYEPAACLAAYARLSGAWPAARAVFAFPDAGYFGLRDGGTYFVADCGAIAPDDLVAHGHGDVLSFECSVAGRRMIVDQGVFEYAAGPRRQASRGSRAHNTLTVEGADQAEFFGDFRCGRRPRVEVLGHARTPTGFVLEGTHDGFAHLPGGPKHVRRFSVTPDEIVIRDRIEGHGRHPATIGFLVHPSCTIELGSGEARIARDGATVDLAASHPLAVEAAVWWPDMGVELPTRRLLLRLAPGSREAHTVLKLMSGSSTWSAEAGQP